ncbi:MAG TPA: hypothetical protein VFI31_24590 [Pirellulales bacterium]|nr:hypothetical protein [Pirellulales bacterium]
MASAQSSSSSVVPKLMATVKRLTPAELSEFKRRFAAWQKKDGAETEQDQALVETCQLRLSVADERRLKTLISKSERGTLDASELREYRSLVSRAEKLDVVRLGALTQLARRWEKPVSAVMEIVGWEDGDGGPTRHPTVAPKTRARPRP